MGAGGIFGLLAKTAEELFGDTSVLKYLSKTGKKVRPLSTHPAYPLPGESLLKVAMPSDAEFGAELSKNDLYTKLAKHLPAKLVRPIGGEAAMTDFYKGAEAIATKEALKYNRKMGMATYWENLGNHLLDEKGDAATLFGTGEKGMTPIKSLKPDYISHIAAIFEEPAAFEVTPGHSAYIRTLETLQDDLYNLALERGVAPGAIAELPNGRQYISRMSKGRLGSQELPPLKGTPKKKIGATQSIEMRREFEDIQEGLKQGYEYGDNPKEWWGSYVRQVFKMIADKELADNIKPLGMPKELAPDWFRFYGKIEDVKFNPNDIARMDNIIQDKQTEWLKGVSNLNSALRTQKASLDFSAGFIQGLFVMFRNPKVWAESMQKQFEFFLHPVQSNKWYSENATLISDFISNGGVLSYHEYMSGMPTILKRLERVKPLKELYYRYGTSFLGWGDVARVKMWEAMKSTTKNPGEQRELTRILNRMTGILSRKDLGISGTQRQVESLLMFAPEYTRAGLALVADAFKGGYTGAEVRKILSLYAGGGVAAFAALKTLVEGKPPTWEDFDPRTGKFMAIKVGDQYVSTGGIIYGLARLIGDTWKMKDKEFFDYFSLNEIDHPLTKFFYRRASPFAGGIIEAIRQKTFIGDPLETISDYAPWVVDKVTPMALGDIPQYVRGLMEQGDVKEENVRARASGKPEQEVKPFTEYVKGTSGVGGFLYNELGFRNFPLQDYDKFNEEVGKRIGDSGILLNKDQQGKLDNGTLAWQNLDPAQRTQILTKFPELEDIKDKAMANSLIYKSPEFQTWSKIKEYNKTTQKTALDRAVAQFKMDGDGQALKDKVQQVYASSVESLKMLEEKFPGVYEKFQKDKEYNTAFDIALEEYRNKVQRSTDLEDQYGNPLFKEIDKRKQEWKDKWGEPYWQALQNFLKFNRDEPELLQFLRESKTTLVRPYYNIPKEETKAREAFRKENPETDAVLYFFGNVSTVLTDEASKLVEELKSQFGVEGLVEAVKPRTANKPINLTVIIKSLARLEETPEDTPEILAMKEKARYNIMKQLSSSNDPRVQSILRQIEGGTTTERLSRS